MENSLARGLPEGGKMRFKQLFIIDLGIRKQGELDAAAAFAERSIGLDPGPGISGQPLSPYRKIAVARSVNGDAAKVHILHSTPAVRVREGFVSHGFVETGTIVEFDERRDQRNPIEDELRTLEDLKLSAERDGATVVEIDQPMAERLSADRYETISWELAPQRRDPNPRNDEEFDKEARELLESCQRFTKTVEQIGEVTYWYQSDRRRWVAMGRLSGDSPVVAFLRDSRMVGHYFDDEALALQDCGTPAGELTSEK